MRQFSLLLLICNFPLAHLFRCINNYIVDHNPLKTQLTVVKCPVNSVCFQGASTFDGSYEFMNEDTRGCMKRESMRELISDHRMGQLIFAPKELESILESSSLDFRVSFEFMEYHFCTSDYCNSSRSLSIFVSLVILLLSYFH